MRLSSCFNYFWTEWSARCTLSKEGTCNAHGFLNTHIYTLFFSFLANSSRVKTSLTLQPMFQLPSTELGPPKMRLYTSCLYFTKSQTRQGLVMSMIHYCIKSYNNETYVLRNCFGHKNILKIYSFFLRTMI